MKNTKLKLGKQEHSTLLLGNAPKHFAVKNLQALFYCFQAMKHLNVGELAGIWS